MAFLKPETSQHTAVHVCQQHRHTKTRTVTYIHTHIAIFTHMQLNRCTDAQVHTYSRRYFDKYILTYTRKISIHLMHARLNLKGRLWEKVVFVSDLLNYQNIVQKQTPYIVIISLYFIVRKYKWLFERTTYVTTEITLRFYTRNLSQSLRSDMTAIECHA